MRTQHILAPTAIAFLASACSHLPEMPEDVLDTAIVVQHIKCEFRRAASPMPQYEWLKEWNADFTLTLSTDEKGSVSANGSLTHPIVPAIFSLPLTADLSKQVVRTEKITFKESVAGLAKPLPYECPEKSEWKILGGNLGFEDLFVRTDLAARRAHLSQTSQLDYTLDFSVVKNATASPKWSLIPLGGRNTMEAGLKWTGNRDRGHTLSITMKPKGAKPTCDVFNDFFGKWGVCPQVIATMDDVLTKGKKPVVKSPPIGTYSLDATPGRRGDERRTPVSREDAIDLDLGALRSRIEDQTRALRRLNIPQ